MKKNNRKGENQSHSDSSFSSYYHGPKRKVIGSIIVLLLVWLFMTGLVNVADDSKPGELLYGIDLAQENLKSVATLNAQTRGRNELALFDERQKEAEQLVIESNINACDVTDSSDIVDNSQHIMTALNLSQERLNNAKSMVVQVTENTQAAEDLNTAIAKKTIHHLQLWEALGRFAPKQTQNTVVQVSQAMFDALNTSLSALPEGRRNDIISGLQLDLNEIVSSIQNTFSVCNSKLDGSETSNGSTGTRSSGGTNNTTGTGTSGTSTRTTGTSGSTGTSGNSGTSGNNGSNGNNNNNDDSGSRLNINANTDNGINVDAGLDENGQLYVEPQTNVDTNGGTGAETSVNDSKVVDTNACPGIMVLGNCVN